MKLYWPMAKTKDGQTLFTYDAALSREKCMEQFDIWQTWYHYRITEAWIDCDGEREEVKLTTT